jgi:hypothetical protein
LALEPRFRNASLILATLAFIPCGRGANPEFTPYNSVQAILDAFAGHLPADLAKPDPEKWSAWNRGNDRAIRTRLERGSLDSMVNLLLYGSSFTRQPRIGIADLAEQARSGVLNSRVQDLVRGLAAPGHNERLSVLREVVLRNGIDLDSPDGQVKAGVFVLENLKRVLEEKRTFATRSAQALHAAKNTVPAGTAGSIFAERSALFRDRGVSLDTGILADFSIDLALRRLKERGVLKPDRVTRVAVIGPGLDFTDKNELDAFDYFPPQTVQPFALINSLLQLNLAGTGNLSLSALDISPLVLGHLQRARQQAEKQRGYVIQLPQDAGRSWAPVLEDYWRDLGDRTGIEVKPLTPPGGLAGLRTRAVQIRPAVVLECHPVNLDIVAQRLDLAPEERYDLVIATNIFLYYDAFQQSLGLQNVASMMKPGAVLLSNDKLPVLPASGVGLIGVTAISDGGPGRDAVAAYRKQ